MIKTVKDPNGNNHQINIDDDFEWLIPFLMEAKKMGIPVWRTNRILGYVVPEGKAEQQSAACLKENNKKKQITILKKHQQLVGNGRVLRVKKYNDCKEDSHYENTLNSLAHELAHLVEWNHTAERFILEAKIMVRFAKLAKQKGYKGYDK